LIVVVFLRPYKKMIQIAYFMEKMSYLFRLFGYGFQVFISPVDEFN
jgi:hypothetical protein